jgi:hypothetical protein
LVSGTTWSVAYPVPTVIDTTTTLTATPSSPQKVGTPVQLTAAVSPSAPGAVQFEANGSAVGSPVTVTGGTASLTTSGLPAGADSLEAVFTPAAFANYAGSDGTTTYTVEQPPAITSAASTTFVKGLAGSFTVTANGYPAPTFSESGSLPSGVNLSAAGVLDGTPASDGTFPLTITASNSAAPDATQNFTLTVAPLGVTTTSLPAGTIEKSYSAKLATIGGKSPFKWSLTQGALPGGLKLATTGTISGTPTAVGTSTFTVTVTDSTKPANTATATLSITIAPLTVTTSTLANGTIGKSYSAKLAANGGKSPLVWSVASGSLPTGLKLATSGTVSGTPTAPGTYDFTLQVHDGAKPANTASAALSITIPPLAVTTTTLANGTVKKSYSVKLAANGGKSLAWSVASGSLPPGLKLATSGAISGTPTTAGVYDFTVQVHDAAKPANTASAALSITVT